MTHQSDKPSALRIVKGVPNHGDLSTRADLSSRGNNSSESRRKELTLEEYERGVLTGDRTLLGRAVTLIESNAASHQIQAQELLQWLLPATGKGIRIAVSGIPGAGKSALIEALGCRLTAQGHKVAVMAVDPSSSLTHGSILGDKTRMEKLSRDPDAFIRPSPTGGALGGVARKTREAMLLFEAAGYDVILLETVGVGQSEILARSMVDFFLLTLVAGAGDELQGLKKGVMEIADAIVINKADGENIPAARLARAQCESALHYVSHGEGWQPRVLLTSALEDSGIAEIWSLIIDFRQETLQSGLWERRRREQKLEWLRNMLDERIRERFYSHRSIKDLLPKMEERIRDGSKTVTQAAWELLHAWEQNQVDVEKKPPRSPETFGSA